MDMLLSQIQTSADCIIIDCPPVLAVTDALALATKVDGVLLVVGSGSTPRQLALKSKTALLGIGARILGVVLNRVDYRSSYYSYNYYSNNYYAGTSNRS